MDKTDTSIEPARVNPYAAPQAPLEPAERTARRFSPLHFLAGVMCLGFVAIYLLFALTGIFLHGATPEYLGPAPIMLLIALLGVRQFRLTWRAPRRPNRPSA